MKKDKKEKLNLLKGENLKKALQKAETAIVKLRLDKNMGRFHDVHVISKKRREIAYIKTKIREEELEKIN